MADNRFAEQKAIYMELLKTRQKPPYDMYSDIFDFTIVKNPENVKIAIDFITALPEDEKEYDNNNRKIVCDMFDILLP